MPFLKAFSLQGIQPQMVPPPPMEARPAVQLHCSTGQQKSHVVLGKERNIPQQKHMGG